MARYLTLQYRAELWLLQQAEGRRRNSRTSEIATKDPRFTDEVKDEIACDLLAILRKIPIQVIGMSISQSIQQGFSGWTHTGYSRELDAARDQSPLCGFHLAGSAGNAGRHLGAEAEGTDLPVCVCLFLNSAWRITQRAGIDGPRSGLPADLVPH